MSTIDPRAVQVSATGTHLDVTLADGRRIIVPLEWFPRLAAGTPPQRQNYRLIGRGVGIHWPDLDEDVSVESLLSTDPLLKYREA